MGPRLNSYLSLPKGDLTALSFFEGASGRWADDLRFGAP